MKKFIRFCKDYIKTKRLQKYYNPREKRAENDPSWVIYMADGKMLHGGLSDRLCGLVSTYCYCMEHQLDFKVYFCSPYDLDYFLLPHKYNWRVKTQDISYNSNDAAPVYISNRMNNEEQRKIADKKLRKRYKQLHVYTNMRYFKGNFKALFDELFTMSDVLKNAVDVHLKELPANYIAITFRFQQLLGDFSEGNFPVLQTEAEKEKLINKCLKCIEKLYEEHKEVSKILVTSDSKIFLEIANKFKYVYVIVGDIVHIDFLKEKADMNVHLKSFVDLFVLSHASEIYLANFRPLWASSFPKTAAFISNTVYKEIVE